MWADRKCVTYDLMVFGCSCFVPLSHLTHLSIAVCDAGRVDPSGLRNWGCKMTKSINDFCPVLYVIGLMMQGYAIKRRLHGVRGENMFDTMQWGVM